MSEGRNKPGANIPCLLFQRSLFPRHRRHPHAATDLASNFVDELSRIKYRGRRRGGRSGQSGGGGGNGGMALLRNPAVSSPHVGPIHSLDVDNSSGGRFLLAGGHDGTVSVYDLFHTRTDPVRDDRLSDGDVVGVSGAKVDAIKPLHRSRRGKRTTPTGVDGHDAPLPRGHVGPISAVQWYPVDSGMFISSSSDGSVMLWDASTCRPAYAFPIGNKSPRRGGGDGSDTSMHPVTCAEMPRIDSHGTNHCLIASGCADDVYLCDVDSGSATHQLVGHTDRVLTVRWSPCQPYHLVSSSRDGTIRLWDVRRSGSTSCLHVFDGEDRLLGSGDDDGSDGHNRMRRKRKDGSKRLRHGPNSYAHVQGASSTVRSSRGGSSSSGSAATNVAYSPDGMYLASSTADGRLALWDVRGLNCPTPSPSLDDPSSRSSSSASSLSTWNFNYPPVLSPSYFLGSGEAGTCPASRGSKSALVVTQPGSSKSAMIWCGNDDGQLLGFDMHGEGGRPRVVLDGHLEGVSSVAVQEGYMRLFTGSRDGMTLSWGCPPVQGAGTLGEGFLLGSVGGTKRRRRGVDEDCWNDYGDRRSRGLSLLSR